MKLSNDIHGPLKSYSGTPQITVTAPRGVHGPQPVVCREKWQADVSAHFFHHGKDLYAAFNDLSKILRE